MENSQWIQFIISLLVAPMLSPILGQKDIFLYRVLDKAHAEE